MTGEFKDHFSDRAARYATYRPRYPEAVGDYLASIAPRRGTAWDVGCGSGQMSTLLGDRFERVIATDASAEQISRAQVHPRVEYAVASAERSGIASSSVDLIVAAQAVHWFDLPRFYKEVRRVGRADSMIALVAYGVTLTEPAVYPVVDHFYSVVLDKWWPPERRHVESDYREIAFPFTEVDSPELTMSVNWTVDEFLGYVGTWSAVRAIEKAEGAVAYEAFVGELRSGWGPLARRVWWKIAMKVGKIGS